MSNLRLLLIAIALLPLVAALITAVWGPRLLRTASHWPAIVAICGSFLLSLIVLSEVRSQVASVEPEAPVEQVVHLWTWAVLPDAYRLPDLPQPLDFQLDVSLRADPLTAIMLCTVTFVAALVTIFSVGYMHGDRGYWRFFAYVALFVFSMTMLVSVSNFLLLFVFWEAVGVCSYLLIGFWFERPLAAAAGLKAFLVNRVGDVGFALGLLLIWVNYGTLNFHDTAAVPGVLGEARLAGELGLVGGVTGLVIALSLMWGACGKSAQIPLHVWLPDAMEGPTPVSALIHAATMVTAGVYMVTRCAPLFVISPPAMVVVAVIGAATALLAGLIAITQFDLKRIMAYSTVSQLGFMFLGLGTGTLAGLAAGMFHLFTHAFFKALLFLASGSVMHAMGNIVDIRRFGGLRHRLPITHATFAVGCLALAGVFPLAGFWSKDAILASVYDRAHPEDPHAPTIHTYLPAQPVTVVVSQMEPTGPIDVDLVPDITRADLVARIYGWLYVIALLSAFLTSLYTFRAFFLTFYGPEEIPSEAMGHAAESPPVMWWPLAILAGLSVVVGAFFAWTGAFFDFLQHVPSLAYEPIRQTHHAEQFHLGVAVASTAMALAGLGLAAVVYVRARKTAVHLKSLLDLQWLKGEAGPFAWIDLLAASRPVQGMLQVCQRLRIGWMARLLGLLVSLPLLLVAAVLWVVSYGSPYRLSSNRFFVDEIYQLAIVQPMRWLAQLSSIIDGWVIDGLVNLLGRLPLWVGAALRPLQSGLIPFYALAMILGLLTLIAVRVVWGG